jgi:hypothetical protein
LNGVFIKPNSLPVVPVREGRKQRPGCTSINEATFENVTAEDSLNIDANTDNETAVEETGKPASKRKKKKQEGLSQEPQVECNLKSYCDTLKNIRELQAFS